MNLHTNCICCGEKFVIGENIFTVEGVRESQISGTCETCFDEMFEDIDNGYGDGDFM